MNNHIKKVSIPPPQPQPVNRPWPEFPSALQVGAAYMTALQFGEEGAPECVKIVIEGASASLVDAYAKLLNSPVARLPRGKRWENYPLHTLNNIGDSLTVSDKPDKERVYAVVSEFGRKLGRKFTTKNEGGGTFKITRIS